MNGNEEIKLALLIQRVDQLTEKVDRMAADLESLKSSAFRVSGGIAVIIVVASIAGWLISLLSGLKLK